MVVVVEKTCWKVTVSFLLSVEVICTFQNVLHLHHQVAAVSERNGTSSLISAASSVFKDTVAHFRFCIFVVLLFVCFLNQTPIL